MPKLPTLLLLAFLLPACTGVSKDVAGGDDDDDDGGDTDETLTVEDICEESTNDFLGCGIPLDSDDATTGCMESDDSYLECLEENLGDCNAESMCVWDAWCPGAGGGTWSCSQTTACQFGCVGNMDPACPCDCVEQMSPDVARYVLANNTCSATYCTVQCDPQRGSQSSCGECMASLCATVDAECQAH